MVIAGGGFWRGFHCFEKAPMAFPSSESKSNRYKSTLLLVKIAMAIWFQVSGIKKHVQSELFIDPKILNVHIIAVGPLVSPLTNP